MKTTFDPQVDFPPESPLNFPSGDMGQYARGALNGFSVGARSGMVNRTHRVVRERAKVLQQRKSRARGLVAPLIVCSVLLFLTGFAIWSGLYQYQTAGAAQVDVSSLSAADTSNQLSAVLLWFVPVSVTLLAIVLYRRSHKSANQEAL